MAPSMALPPTAGLPQQAKALREDLVIFDTVTEKATATRKARRKSPRYQRALPAHATMSANAISRRENIGRLSGGGDSALSPAIAVDAIGKENVLGVSMPGPFTP